MQRLIFETTTSTSAGPVYVEAILDDNDNLVSSRQYSAMRSGRLYLKVPVIPKALLAQVQADHPNCDLNTASVHLLDH